MEQTLSAKYARVTQQLQKKKDEVDHLMSEAKQLDTENRRLVAENAQLKANTVELESQLSRRVQEFSQLEIQVKRQQLRLQEFIDAEANGAMGRATKQVQLEAETKKISEVHEKRIDELNARLRTLHDSRQALNEAAETYKKTATSLKSENDSLKKSAETYETRVAEITTEAKRREAKFLERIKELESQTHEHISMRSALEAESAHISDLDVKAKDALKTEFLALVAEVDRLQNEVDNERKITVTAKQALAEQTKLLISARQVSDDSARIAALEIEALSSQQDNIINDLREAIKERDAARKRESECERKRKDEASAAEAAISAAVVTAREAVASGPTSPRSPSPTRGSPQVKSPRSADRYAALQSESQRLQRLNEQLQSQATDLGEQLRLAQLELSASKTDKKELEDDVRQCQRAQQELLDNSMLREERETLQAELRLELHDELTRERDLALSENKLLQQQVDDALLEIKNCKGGSPVSSAKKGSGMASPSDIAAVESTVHKLLVLAAAVLQEVPSSRSNAANDSRSSSIASDGSMALPTTVCDAYALPVLNSIHRQCGGIGYVLKKLRGRCKRLLNRQGAGRGNMDHSMSQVASDGESTDVSGDEAEGSVVRVAKQRLEASELRQQRAAGVPPAGPRRSVATANSPSHAVGGWSSTPKQQQMGYRGGGGTPSTTTPTSTGNDLRSLLA